MLHAGNKNIKLDYRCGHEVKKNIMQTFALRFICFFSNKSSWVKNNYMTSVMITAIFLLKCPFPPKICNENSIAQYNQDSIASLIQVLEETSTP